MNTELALNRLIKELRSCGFAEEAERLETRTEEQWKACETERFNRRKFNPSVRLADNLARTFLWDMSPEGRQYWHVTTCRAPGGERYEDSSHLCVTEECDQKEDPPVELPSGAVRAGSKKPRPDLISPFTMKELHPKYPWKAPRRMFVYLLEFQITGDCSFLPVILSCAVSEYEGILMRIGEVMRAGAEKYTRVVNGVEEKGDRNWEKGTPVSRAFASAYRHILQELNEEKDEDHLAAFLCNVMIIHHTLCLVKKGLLPEELDDLPHYSEQAPEKEESDGSSESDCSKALKSMQRLSERRPKKKRIKLPSEEALDKAAQEELDKRCEELEAVGQLEAADKLRKRRKEDWNPLDYIQLAEEKDLETPLDEWLLNVFEWDLSPEGTAF